MQVNSGSRIEHQNQNHTIKTLIPPFHTLKQIDIENNDIYHQSKFSELIIENHKKNKCYLIAMVIDKNNRIEAFDAFSFTKDYYVHENKFLATTRQPIIDFIIYQLNNPDNSEFKQFCSKDDFIGDQKEKYLGYISANCSFDVEELGAEMKKMIGTDQYNIGLENEKKENYLEAIKWYHLAAENENVSAMLRLALWYEKGFAGTKVDVELSFFYWLQAANTSERGDVNYYVASVYEEGKLNVKKDLKEAYKYYLRAKAFKFKRAIVKVKELRTHFKNLQQPSTNSNQQQSTTSNQSFSIFQLFKFLPT